MTCIFLQLFYYNSYLNLHRGEWHTGRGPFCTHRGLSVSHSPPARRWTASELLALGSNSSCVGRRAATGKLGTPSAAERRLEWSPSHLTLQKTHISIWNLQISWSLALFLCYDRKNRPLLAEKHETWKNQVSFLIQALGHREQGDTAGMGKLSRDQPPLYIIP